MDTENRLTADRGEGVGGWVRRVKGLSKEIKRNTHGHRQQYGNCQREGRWREVEEDKGGINGDGRRLDLGW